MKLIDVQKQMRKAGIKVFTTVEFQRVTGMSATGSRKFLLRYTALGVFWQIKRGLYAVRDDRFNSWQVANKLYQPSYISLETALSHYGCIPETVYGITSITTRTTREFEACELVFYYHSLKREAYTGYAPLKINGETVLVAEPEKALADYLYFVHLGKKSFNDRLTVKNLGHEKLWHYLKLFNRKHLLERSRDVIRKQH